MEMEMEMNGDGDEAMGEWKEVTRHRNRNENKNNQDHSRTHQVPPQDGGGVGISKESLGEIRPVPTLAPAKSKRKKAKLAKLTVAQAALSIDPLKLSISLAEISDSFSTSPDLRMKQCVEYLSQAFALVNPSQFQWSKILMEIPIVKSSEIPLCFIPEPVVKALSEWLITEPTDILREFVLRALTDAIYEAQAQSGLQKGVKGAAQNLPVKTKVATLVMVAIILQKKSDMLIHKPKSAPLFQNQEKLTTLAWACAQVAHGDLVAGMYLWVQNLLPLAVGKTSTPSTRDIVLQFIESVLFQDLKKSRPIFLNNVLYKGERLVSPNTLNSFMHLAFLADTTHAKATEKFSALYPFIKELALRGSKSGELTRDVAQQLLALSLASAAEDVEALSYEACNNFIWCLSQNPDCYKQWEKLHLDNLKGSGRVLKLLYTEWESSTIRFSSLDDLGKTIQSFKAKNRAALESAKGNEDSKSLLCEVDKYCKLLSKRLTWHIAPCFKTMGTVVATFVIGYGLYLLSPEVNPWGWDGKLLLSKTHFFSTGKL